MMDRVRWHKLSILEQMANIGSEVGRAVKWQKKDSVAFEGAFGRALELFDLTLQDPRWQKMRGRLKEIARAREFFCGAILGLKNYNVKLADLDAYFMHFAYGARINR